MKEKGFLGIWILGCFAFYVSLESQTLAWILPGFPLRTVLFLLFGASFLFLFSKKRLVILKHPLWAFLIPLGVLTFFFLKKFPLDSFSSLIFQDDFTSLYAASLRSSRMLAEGSLFGWDNRLLGGYPTVSDINFNLGLFLGPFYLLFHPPLAYHLFIFLLVLLFPCLVYGAARPFWKEKEIAAVSFWIASFFAVSFFRNILLWGNIDNLLGVDLFLLFWIVFLRCGSKKSFFGLAVLLILLAYAHLSYFLYALGLVGLSFFAPLHRKRAFSFCLVGLVILLACSSYALHLLRDPELFNFNAKRYQPAPLTVERASQQSIRTISSLTQSRAWFTAGYEGVHGGNYGAAAILFLPFLLFLFWADRHSRLLILFFLLVLFVLPLKTALGLALKRVYFLIPVLLSLLLSRGIFLFSKKGIVSVFLMVPSLLVGTVGIPSTRPVPYQPTLASFFPSLYQRLVSLEGHTLFLETQALWIESNDGKKGEVFPGPHVHMEMLLALETGKRFLAHGKDGYPFTIYRDTCLMSGIWKGNFLESYAAEEVNPFLKKWGVLYVIVWSQTAKRFLSSYPDFYEKVWEESPWAIFRFKEADSRSVDLSTGKGEMIEEKYTRVTVRLTGVRRGEEAVLRMNAHPRFHAVFDGKPLPLYSREGQIAFKIPKEGDLTVTLFYPRYLLFSLVGLGALSIAAFFVWRKK